MTRRPSSLPPLTLLAALLALLTLLATACQRSDPDSPAATLDEPTAEPEPTPTADPEPAPTPSPDPTTYAIPENPEDLTTEYFEHVLQALLLVESKAVRDMIATETVTADAKELLRAVHHPEQADRVIDQYEEELGADLPNTRRPPGDQAIELHRVISATESCAFVAGLLDLSEVVVNPRDRTGEEDFFQLLQLVDEQDPRRHNPTPWVLGGSELRDDGSQPEDPCA